MNTRELAERFLEQLADTENLKVDRSFTKVVQGDSFVLNYLYTHNCQAHPKEISTAMAVTSARIAKIIRDLKSKDLITRVIDINDSRQVVIILTSKGIAYVQELREEAIAKIEQGFSVLDEKDIADFIRIKDKITKAMQDKNIPD
ncbi:MAG: MarR family winged helix-turn-helix transcriptional regulator [Eubacterium sp.]